MEKLAAAARGAPASAALAGTCAAGSLYAAWAMETDPSANNIALVASNTLLMNWYLWTMLTGHLVEANLLKAIIFVPIVFVLSVRLERGFGPRGFATYLVSACVTMSILVIIMLLCELPVSIYYFYNSTFYGHAGLVVALLVGNVRTNVEDQLGPTRIKTRVAVVPAVLAYALLTAFDDSVHEEPSAKWAHDAAFVLFAFPVSFVLIKLFDFADRNADAVFPSRVTYSDDPFTLDAFFPQPARPFIRAVGILLENAAVRFCGKCYKRPTARPGFAEAQRAAARSFDDIEGWGSTGAFSPASSRLGARKITNPVAERRRLRALKALDQKLAQISREPEIAFDSDDEDGDGAKDKDVNEGKGAVAMSGAGADLGDGDGEAFSEHHRLQEAREAAASPLPAPPPPEAPSSNVKE